jgi:hypothetical protein
MRLLALLLVVVFTACQSPSGPSKPPEVSPAKAWPPSSADLVLLTASNHLQRLQVATGAISWDVQLGDEEQQPFTAHVIAPTKDRKLIAVLVRGASSEVALVDTESGSVVGRRALPSGLSYRALDVGPISGRLYVFGSLVVGPSRGETPGPAADAVVTILAPDLSALVMSPTARYGTDANWLVFQGKADPSESHLLVSYHGTDTTGIDMIALDGNRLVNPCTQPRVGCIQSHGGFVTRGDRLYMATGGSKIIEADTSGKALQEIETGIENEHLMEFTLDSTGSRLFFAGSCRYSRGLFVVDLRTRKTRALAKQRSSICGERVLVADEARLVIIDPDIRVVDAETGQEERRIKRDDPPVDGLVLAA